VLNLRTMTQNCIYCIKHQAEKMYWRSGGITSCILNLGTRCRWVVSFTPRPLCPLEKIFWYPFDRSVGAPQSRSGRGGEEKKIPSPVGSRIPVVQSVT